MRCDALVEGICVLSPDKTWSKRARCSEAADDGALGEAGAESDKAAGSIEESTFSSFDTAQVDRAYSALGGSAATSVGEDVDYVHLGSSSISTSDSAAAGMCVR